MSVPSISKEFLELGYETFLVKDATRGITSEGIEHALDEMTKAGIKIITSDTLMATGNTSKKELWSYFCGRNNEEYGKLVYGKSVFSHYLFF